MFGRRRFASVQSVRHIVGIQTLRLVFLAVVGLSLLAAGPVVAQESNQSAEGATNPICQEDSDTLATMLEGFVQLTTGLGIMGLLVVWQADSLMEMFTLSREQKTAIKQHKRGALKSAGVLVLLGPLFTIAGSMMGLPIAECVNLMPF